MSAATGRESLPDQVGMGKPPMGTVVLNGLTPVAVACPAVTANSLIFTSIQAGSGTLGVIQVVSKTPGTGFTINSVALAASVVAWAVMEP